MNELNNTTPATEDAASDIQENTNAETVSSDPKEPVVIEVNNPTKEEMDQLRENIKANYDFNVDVKHTRFNFKKSKDKETGIETVRQPVDLAIPYPSVEGIIAILEEGGKQLELLMDSMADVINSAARDILYEDFNMTAANFPVEKISWDAISKIPKATRRGGGIPKETWEEFAADYIAVMPEATGKSVEQVTNAAKILQNKMNQVKTNEAVLELLVEQLAVYAENSPNAEDYMECVEFLLKKADTFLNVSQEELLANL